MTVSPVLPSSPALAARPPGFQGWQMVARGFLCQNAANGFLFGTFGATLLAVQHRLNSSSAAVSLGISLALATMGLLSPLTARMLDLLTLRWTMACGVVLSSAGYLLLAFVPNRLMFLLVYALLIGPGIAMFGSLASSILASNWFVARQGTAVGIVNVPIVVAIAPIVTVALLGHYGLRTFYLCLAAGDLLLLPAVLTIVERPESIGQHALGAGQITPTAELVADEVAAAPVALLALKSFWVMVVGGGMLMGISVAAIAHIVALAVERGLSMVQSSLLVSVIGGTSMLGALLVGILCDRIGPARALALTAAGFCAAWLCILMTTWLPALVLAVAVYGVCAGGLFPAISVLARHLFGGHAMARAIGLFLLFTLPLNFCSPPLAGWVRDVTGSYNLVIAGVIVISGLVCAAFIGLWHVERRIAQRTTPPAQA